MSRDSWLMSELERHGITRRELMKYFAGTALLLGLPESVGPKLARAVEKGAKPSLIWLEFQDCTGDTEGLLRASRPTVADIVLDTLSVDYHETIMAAAGKQAEEARDKAVEAGSYICVVEGSIPTGADGAYCCIGGESAINIARRVCGKAAATIAIGSCASYGGLPAASPNPTGALSVSEAVPGIKNLINLPACPANPENLTALIVHYLSFGRFPALDALNRPMFAYGKRIHDNCERRAHFDAGQYVEAWGDEGHRLGYCLYKMGCKGPVSYHNCPNVRWNEATNWPIGCGHPCIGCAEPQFWDNMTPFYRHLPDVPGFGVGTTVDKAGVIATGIVGATFATHGLVQFGRRWLAKKSEATAGTRKPPSPTTPSAPIEGSAS
jgi:hydrogenase small subunit